MSIKSRILSIISAARAVRGIKTEPAPQIVPVFAAPMVVTQQDDILSQVARLRSQGYSLRAVSAELGVSYRQARKLSAVGEAAGIW